MPHKIRDIEERFSEKVVFGDEDECWEWTASCWKQTKRSLPYGMFKIRTGRRRIQWTARAPQVAFYLAAGYWPGYVCHTCDNPKCVNPNHLYDGSPRENMDDMRRRNRRKGKSTHNRGGRAGVPRPTTPHAVAEVIREQYALGRTQKSIAAEFGLSPGGVGRIVRGETRSGLKRAYMIH